LGGKRTYDSLHERKGTRSISYEKKTKGNEKKKVPLKEGICETQRRSTEMGRGVPDHYRTTLGGKERHWTVILVSERVRGGPRREVVTMGVDYPLFKSGEKEEIP